MLATAAVMTTAAAARAVTVRGWCLRRLRWNGAETRLFCDLVDLVDLLLVDLVRNWAFDPKIR